MIAFDTKRGIFGPGGHGGGIFQTTVAGLGATETGPMGVKSEKTLSVQIEANAVLPRLGQPKLTEDGILGPKTCAAIKTIVASGSYPAWSVPDACSGGSSVTTSSSLPSTFSEPSSFSPSSGTMKKLGIAAVVAVLVGGLALFVLKRKK